VKDSRRFPAKWRGKCRCLVA